LDEIYKERGVLSMLCNSIGEYGKPLLGQDNRDNDGLTPYPNHLRRRRLRLLAERINALEPGEGLDLPDWCSPSMAYRAIATMTVGRFSVKNSMVVRAAK
jgi:hypothetical protein